jgi:hypothetical protein
MASGDPELDAQAARVQSALKFSLVRLFGLIFSSSSFIEIFNFQ